MCYYSKNNENFFIDYVPARYSQVIYNDPSSIEPSYFQVAANPSYEYKSRDSGFRNSRIVSSFCSSEKELLQVPYSKNTPFIQEVHRIPEFENTTKYQEGMPNNTSFQSFRQTYGRKIAEANSQLMTNKHFMYMPKSKQNQYRGKFANVKKVNPNHCKEIYSPNDKEIPSYIIEEQVIPRYGDYSNNPAFRQYQRPRNNSVEIENEKAKGKEKEKDNENDNEKIQDNVNKEDNVKETLKENIKGNEKYKDIQKQIEKMTEQVLNNKISKDNPKITCSDTKVNGNENSFSRIIKVDQGKPSGSNCNKIEYQIFDHKQRLSVQNLDRKVQNRTNFSTELDEKDNKNITQIIHFKNVSVKASNPNNVNGNKSFETNINEISLNPSLVTQPNSEEPSTLNQKGNRTFKLITTNYKMPFQFESSNKSNLENSSHLNLTGIRKSESSFGPRCKEPKINLRTEIIENDNKYEENKNEKNEVMRYSNYVTTDNSNNTSKEYSKENSENYSGSKLKVSSIIKSKDPKDNCILTLIHLQNELKEKDNIIKDLKRFYNKANNFEE